MNFKVKCLFCSDFPQSNGITKIFLYTLAFLTQKSHINSKESYNSYEFYFHRFKTLFFETEGLWEMVLSHLSLICITEVHDSTNTN